MNGEFLCSYRENGHLAGWLFEAYRVISLEHYCYHKFLCHLTGTGFVGFIERDAAPRTAARIS